MEFELTGAKEPELACEIRIRKQLHRLQDAAKARGGNDMRNRTIVACYRHKRPTLGRVNGSSRLPLEVLNAVCIFHEKKVSFTLEHVKSERIIRLPDGHLSSPYCAAAAFSS